MPIFRSALGFQKHQVMSVIYDYSDIAPEQETCIFNASKQTMSEEDKIIIKDFFQELFNNKLVSSRHNKEQDSLAENDRLQAMD